MKYKNTLQKGSVRYIVFKEGGVWYAAGLEFNIVESGSSPQEAMLLLFEALEGYVESARKIKARPDILNQKIDPEYEEMWKSLEAKKTLPQKSVFTFGQRSFVPA
jgi:predicted RNase H-like HicB family nuclease